MARGMVYLHSREVLHRDLKPENILLMGESNTDIRLIDFGVSNTTGDDGMCQSQCGTLIYMAPEMMSVQSRIGPSVDNFYLGVVMWEVWCRR